MKVGDYVRFDYHRVSIPIQIAQIEDIFYDEEEKYYIYRTDVGAVITDENIIGKSSSNPIDLIEVGDYVNEHRVSNVFDDYITTEDDQITIDKEDITSIVTKEQFESMEYKVGD